MGSAQLSTEVAMSEVPANRTYDGHHAAIRVAGARAAYRRPGWPGVR
jgi:hypothetical protein